MRITSTRETACILRAALLASFFGASALFAMACTSGHAGKPGADADVDGRSTAELVDGSPAELSPDLPGPDLETDADKAEIKPDLVEITDNLSSDVEVVDATSEVDLPDGGAELDLPLDSGDAGPAFPFGIPCDADADCGKGVCLATPLGGVCTRNCDAGCPDGWLCWQVEAGELCVPPQIACCDECDPEVPPVFEGLSCLPLGETFHFLPACSEEGECPPGLECGEVGCPPGFTCPETACLPASGRCDCLPADNGTEVPCSLANEWGTCTGTAPCFGDDGVGQCVGKKAKQEVCNGEDDDCDGLLDEAAPDCQPAFCIQEGLKFYLKGAESCVGGKCTVLQEKAFCGLLACDKVGIGGTCLTGCTKNVDCVVEAFCGEDGACHLQKVDGAPCSLDAHCQSQHCNHGICCAAGDCCFDADFCSSDFESPPMCDDPMVCQGHRQGASCVNLMCQAGPNVPDDSACDQATQAADCWPFPPVFCNGLEKQFPPACAKGCLGNADCGPGSHCDSTCKPDLADGYSCDEDSDCLSGHCDSKICCAQGVCCNSDAGCKALFSSPPACIDPTHCQGSRVDAACTDHVCQALAPVPDDSACTSKVLADDCGAAADFYCTGDPVQAVPECAYECFGPADCDGDQQCMFGQCNPRHGDGKACNSDEQCLSGHCANGYCCASGDCCDKASHCPPAYSSPPACNSPQTCQGSRNDATCVDSMCGTVGPIEDDSGCGKAVLAKACAPYPDQFCTGGKAQPIPTCGSACQADADCTVGAHCDEICKPDLSDGMSCDEDSDCQSEHCGNGFCCETGDCCQVATDCPGSWTAAPTCDIPDQCQGHREDAVCASFQCQSNLLGDDSACDADVPAGECGPFAALVCSGKSVQTKPQCAVSCQKDAQCAAGHHCDGVCLQDQGYGDACDEDSDCQSEHCSNGFCCDSGICCSVAADCPASFAAPPACLDPSSCQGSRTDRQCKGFACTSVTVEDDSACTPKTVVDECGPFPSATCNAMPDQAVPVCATQCAQDAQCDPAAHCDGTCLADLGPSASCDEDSDCIAGHCGNGFCCTQGDCCTVAADCPPQYHSAAVCDDSVTCQGHRIDAACTDAKCLSVTVEDDSACSVEVLADDCGPNPDIHCDGTVAQVQPKCSPACLADKECGTGYHCDSTCKPDVADGLSCDEDSDCKSGHCANAFCCQSGDCCQFAYHCPESYAETPVCEQPSHCQGKRKDRACVQSMCASQPVDDDSACAADLVSQACGLYKDRLCNGQKYQATPQCPGSCLFDAECDAGSHCDGSCLVNLADGSPCNEATDCQSGHCGNGFCCSESSCCFVAADCPAPFASPPVCGQQATCQGTRKDKVCAGFVCETATVADDSACTPALTALDCGYFLDRHCSGAGEQQPPACDVACTADAACDAAAHCDAGLCLPDMADGGVCDEDSDCQSGNCTGGVCCKGGDCCIVAADCPAAYMAPSSCLSPATCQGERLDPACQDFVCGTKVVPDDSACGVDVTANGCGAFLPLTCKGTLDQVPPKCPTTCSLDAQCDPGAHCDGTCMGNLADGKNCDEDSDCQSGHCAHGICCKSGDCCILPKGCPAQYKQYATCDDAPSCQGHRVDASCTQYTCGSQSVDDDSGCGWWVTAADCGPYVPEVCSGEKVQSTPLCPQTCATDADCKASAHCDGMCVFDLADGAACDEDSDCVSAHCANGHCCSQGDCCAKAADCPAGYKAPATCTDKALCQGTRTEPACQASRCVSIAVADDSACTAQVQALACQPYAPRFCTGAADQNPPACPVSCAGDDDCLASAHCDGSKCTADLADGLTCDEDSDCQSSHCGNGFCCASGDCCLSPLDCPGAWSSLSQCVDPGQCQGQRQDATCVAFQCGTKTVADDTGCTPPVEADSCGPYKSVYCDGKVDQLKPSCPTTCVLDSSCDPSAHCDGTCQVDLANGQPCDETSDCISTFCVSAYCCNSACTALGYTCNVPGKLGQCVEI